LERQVVAHSIHDRPVALPATRSWIESTIWKPGTSAVVNSPEDMQARRKAAEVATRERPQDPAAWIALSQACQALADDKAAQAAGRRALELAPDNTAALRQLAESLFHGPGMAEARPLFERLLVLAPTDLLALHYLYYYAMFESDYRRAVELRQTMDRHYPGSPETSASIGLAYKVMGNATSAAEHYGRAASCCDEDHPFPYGRYAAMKPVFADHAGSASESERLSAALCREDGEGIPDLANSKYPDNCAQAIEHLQRITAGRDIFIFGFGPSLEQITARRTEIAALDFASMTLSNFPIIEENVLIPIGKRLDMLCITHPGVAENHAAAIREWLSAVPTAVLAATLWMRDYAASNGRPDFLMGHPDRLLWLDAFNGRLPPSPEHPLHIPNINTLLFALGAATLAKPRRIFLFGFDGRIKGEDSQQQGALYFKEDHKDYHTPRRLEPAVRWFTKAHLWWDTIHFDEVASVTMRHLALLFDLPRPLIYNVCPDSALESFPRITFDRFLEIVSDRDNGH
jgi:tetratricopeptide (TPR) repeat protein